MAKKSPLKKPENVRFKKQVEASLERQKVRMAQDAKSLDRPGAKTAAPENTFNQTDTGNQKAKVDNANKQTTQHEQRQGKNSAKNPQPKGSQTTGGGKTTSGNPGAGSNKPNYNPRNQGPGKFGNRPPPKTPPQPGVGKVKGTVGTVGAFALGAEGLDTLKKYPEQQEAFAKYGHLAPEESRTKFNPLSRGVDMVAGMFGAEPQLLERTMSRFTDKPVDLNDNGFQRDAMYSYAAAKEGGVDLKAVTPDMLENVRGRADRMRSQISEGTFDPRTLTEEDAQLARNLGVDIDNIEPPAETRTGIPPEKPTLGGGGLERSDLADTPTDFRDPDDPDVSAPIDVAQDADAQVVLEKIQRGEPVGPIEVGIAEQLEQAGQIDGYTQGGTTTAPSYTDTNTDLERVTPPPAGQDTPFTPEADTANPTLFRKVGEDGVIEYSDQGGEGYEAVDLNLGRNTKGGFVAAQDNIQDFPGTSAFVQSISRDANARKRDFRRQQRKARAFQGRLPQRARSAVLAGNRDLARTAKKGGLAGGVASHALNEYTLKMADIMQKGRDAYTPEDFDTTTPVIEADRNDATYANIDANLERTQTYRDANEIAAFKAIQEGQMDALELQQKYGEQGGEVTSTYLSRHYSPTTPDGEVNPMIGRHDALLTSLTDGTETPRQMQEKNRQAHFLAELSQYTSGVALNPQDMLNENFINRILNGDFSEAGITAQKNPTVWQRIKNPYDTTKADFSSNELDSGIIDFKGQTITLEQLLDMAQGYGKMKGRSVDLARRKSER